MFIVPTNNDTNTIDYGMRFMITDNLIYPKTYEATKLMDTFPLGTLKVTLGQSHYNEHTDLCGKYQLEEIGDDEEVMHMICDYNKSPIKPTTPKDEDETVWKLEPVNSKMRIKYAIQIKAITESSPIVPCVWKIEYKGVTYTDFTDSGLESFEIKTINIPDPNISILSVKALNKDTIGNAIKVICNDDDFTEMEVING